MPNSHLHCSNHRDWIMLFISHSSGHVSIRPAGTDVLECYTDVNYRRNFPNSRRRRIFRIICK